MSVDVVPFTTDHLDAAAALLAARYRRDRAWVPDLSPVYEDPAAAQRSAGATGDARRRCRGPHPAQGRQAAAA